MNLLNFLLEGSRMEKPNNCTDEMYVATLWIKLQYLWYENFSVRLKKGKEYFIVPQATARWDLVPDFVTFLRRRNEFGTKNIFALAVGYMISRA